MGVEIWLSFNNREEVLQLPITPYWEVSRANNNQVVNVYEVGDMNLPGNSGLAEMEISSFFPANGHRYWFSKYSNVPDPLDAVALIEKWRKSKRPIRVIITERDVNLAMLIESFQYGEQNKGGDIYFTLKLKEYLFPKAPRLSTADATTTANTKHKRHNDKFKTWIVKYGDTLTGIAMAKWGDASKYKTIIELNKDLIKNPNSLKAIVGQELVLEKASAKEAGNG